MNSTVAPQVNAVADSAFEPRLIQNNTSYVYATTYGNYTFSRGSPQVMAYNSSQGIPLVAASTVVVRTLGVLPPTNPRVVASTNFSFVVEYNVIVDPYNSINATVRINTSFSAYRPPEIAARFILSKAVPSLAFNLQWEAVPSEYYLEVGSSQIVDIRSLWSLLPETEPNFTARVGDSPSLGSWSKSIRLDWSSASSGALYAGPLDLPGPLTYGVLVAFPTGNASFDPSIVGTTTSTSYATAYPHERKTFSYDGYYWALYDDGTGVRARESPDGTQWSAASDPGTGSVKPIPLSNGVVVLLVTHWAYTTLWWRIWSAGSWTPTGAYYSQYISLAAYSSGGFGGSSDSYSWISAVTTTDDTIWVAYADQDPIYPQFGGLSYVDIYNGGTGVGVGNIVPRSTSVVQYPSLVVDGSDNLYAFWSRYDSTSQTFYVKYNVKGPQGWSATADLFSRASLAGAGYLSAAVAASDQASMVWTQQGLGPGYLEVDFLSLPLPIGLGTVPWQPWSRAGISPYGQYFRQLSEYVAPGSGLLTTMQTDVSLPGRGLDLTISRVFSTPRTFLADANGNPYPYLNDSFNGANLGLGWQLNFPWVGKTYLHLWEGQTYLVRWDSNNAFENHVGEHFRLEKLACGSVCYRLTTKSGVRYDFDSAGRLLKVTDTTGKNYIAFGYGANGIATITDTVGRVVTFGYDGNGRLSNLSWSGRTVQYQYTAAGQLFKVIDPASRTTSFYYNATNKYLLAGVTYPSGGRTSYVYGKASVGTEASTYPVTLQNVYNGSSLVKSTSFSYDIINGRVAYAKVTYSNASAVQGYMVYIFGSPSNGMNATELDANGVQMKRTRPWYTTDGEGSQVDVYSGNVDAKTYSTYQFYDNWGNLIYSRDALGHERFASFANTNSAGTFYAPGRLDQTSSGKIMVANFDDRTLNGWALDTSGGTIGLDSGVDTSSAPSIKVTTTSSTAVASARRYFAAQGGKFVAEGRILVAQSDKTTYFLLKSGSNIRVYFSFKDNGQLNWYNSSGDHYGWMSYAPNRWYRIAFEVDVGANKYNIWVDGYEMVIGAGLYGTSGNIDNLVLQPGWVGITPPVTMYGDDFSVYTSGSLTVSGLTPGAMVEALDGYGQVIATSVVGSGSSSATVNTLAVNSRQFYLRVYNDTQPIKNGNMEGTGGWTFYRSQANFLDGGLAGYAAHSGAWGHIISASYGPTFYAGDWASLYQDIAGFSPKDMVRVWFAITTDICSTGNLVSARLSITDYGANSNMKDMATVSEGGANSGWAQLTGIPGKSNFRLHLRLYVNIGFSNCLRSLYIDDADGSPEFVSPSRDLWGGDVYSYSRPLWKRGDFYNASSPVLYYDMQTTSSAGSGLAMQDLSGNGNKGTVTGTTSVDGSIGMARSFNGTSDYLALPDELIRSRTVLSVAAWFKTTSGGVIWGYDDEPPPMLPATYVPALYVGSDGKLRGEFWMGSASPITSGGVVNDGNWHHVVLVSNANTQSLYLDSSLVGTLSGTINQLDMMKSQIGTGRTAGWPYSRTGGWEYFNGAIDEVYIYDRALSGPEVTQLSQRKGPVLYYDMEILTQSGQMQDLSGKDNHGTITGTTSVNGFLGLARQFNGLGDYIQSPIFPLTNQATVSAWVYFVDGQPAGDYGGIISNLNGYYPYNNRLLLKGANTVLWQVSIGGITYNHFFTLPGDQRNAWHHYALVYDGANVRLFWDGTQVGPDQARTGNLDSGTTNPTVGWGSGTIYHLNGVIDEFQVYNRALGASEVKDNYLRKMPTDAHDRLIGTLEWQNGSLDPLLYYDMQTLARPDLVKDLSGHGNEGTLIGTVDAAGFAGRARQFNGVGDYISTNQGVAGSGSIAAWVNPSATTAWEVVVGIKNSAGNAYLLLDTDGTHWRAVLKDTSTSSEIDALSTTVISTGKWVHLAMTWDMASAMIRLYVNGVQEGSASMGSENPTRLTDTYSVGASRAGWNYFQGTLDEVYIFNRALSAAEVKEMATKVLFLDMETFASSNVLKDLSGYSNAGTTTGTAPLQGKVGKALQFNGASDYVQVPQSASINLTAPITVAFWAKWLSFPPGDGTCGAGHSSTPVITKGSYLGAWWFELRDTGDIGFWITVTGGVYVVADFGIQDLNTWHHYAATYDNSNIRIFRDGGLVTTVAETRTLQTTTNPLSIAKGFGGGCGSKYTNGVIDEVKLYNKALSATDISGMFMPRTTLPTRAFFRYDLQGQLLESRTYHNGSWVYTQSTYDPFGNVVWQSDADGKVTRLTYSSQYGYAYPTQVTRPDGTTEGYTYDFQTGLPLSKTDANGFTTSYGYDTLGRLKVTNNPTVGGVSSSTSIAYDDRGNSVTLYDENSKPRLQNFDMETTVGTSALGTARLYYDMERVFDGKMEDLSGGGNHGTINGTTSVNGKWGLARSFAGGSTDAISTSSTPALPKLSLAAWINPSAFGAATQRIIAIGAWNAAGTAILYIDASGFARFGLATPDTQIASNSALSLNTWTHIVGTWDGTTMRLYVNGVVQTAAATFTGGAPGPGATWSEGAVNTGVVIDEVYVFDRPLSGSDIYRLYAQNTVAVLEDLSGNGNHGVTYGTSVVQGKVGNARSFNGASDYISVAKSAGLDMTSSVSLAAWINPGTAATSAQRIISRWSSAASNEAYLFSYGDSGSAKVRFAVQAGGVVKLVDSTTILQANTWYHVVGVYDGSNVHIYVNGVEDAAPVAASGALTVSAAGLAIGRESDASSFFFNGVIDEVHIRNRTLAASDVQALYQGTEVGHYGKRYFDGIGRIIKSSRRDFFGTLSSSSTQVYNWQDQVTGSTDPMGNVYTTGYDFLGRATRVTNPEGSSRTTNYYDVNNTVVAVDEVVRRTSYQYDWNGRLVKVGEWNPATSTYNYTTYTYLEDGHLAGVADASGKVTRHTYDDLGRLVRTDFPDGNATYEAYVYDNGGNFIQKTLRNGTVLNYAYDSMNRLINATYPNGGWVSRTYDKAGNLLKVRGPVQGVNPWILWFQYDARNRMTLEAQNVDGTNRTVAYGYDAASNLISMTYGGTTFTYSYDNFNRNTQVSSGSTNYATFTFRPDDRISSTLYGNNVKTTFTFDPKRSWPLHLWANASGGTGTNLLNMAYTYNVAGEVTKLQVDRSGVHLNETYLYDGQDRLFKYTYTSGATTYVQTYGYDSVGNRLSLNDNGVSSTYTYREDNRLVRMVNGTAATNYYYDPNGNLYQRVQGTTTRTFTFDYSSLLTKVVEGGTTLASLGYDGLGRRVKGVEGGTTTYYLFAGSRAVLTVAGTTTTTYLYANGLLVAKPSASLYVHQDHLGSVRLITSSSAGTNFASDYRPFGSQTNAAGTDQSLKFTGQWRSSGTGLDYLGARWYDPAMGRFISQDPLLQELSGPQRMNRYVYVHGNPLNFVDPSGHGEGGATMSWDKRHANDPPITAAYCPGGTELGCEIYMYSLMGMAFGGAAIVGAEEAGPFIVAGLGTEFLGGTVGGFLLNVGTEFGVTLGLSVAIDIGLDALFGKPITLGSIWEHVKSDALPAFVFALIWPLVGRGSPFLTRVFQEAGLTRTATFFRELSIVAGAKISRELIKRGAAVYTVVKLGFSLLVEKLSEHSGDVGNFLSDLFTPAPGPVWWSDLGTGQGGAAIQKGSH